LFYLFLFDILEKVYNVLFIFRYILKEISFDMPLQHIINYINSAITKFFIAYITDNSVANDILFGFTLSMDRCRSRDFF